ncbi:aminotransferase class I/II-fold pyridoxal phosphate-dependent enzyme [Georgenia faecalis]|uniref:aminotransferase class I/II-fold pyridoxal phosphate-dependent enzyme n=1 Tax=Georgenia faecalis TaxID=2483799 RepID=UPI000FD8E4F0|nr:aminotransferase class I/II-fold pyridoxal phosphate-dependent enzyme [Georgenia faecalis]
MSAAPSATARPAAVDAGPACPGPGGFPEADPGWGPQTRSVHAGHARTGFQETSEALFLTQGYVYDQAADAEAAFLGEVDRFTYSRYENPTVSTFEERLRSLEGAQACYATATGMAAVFSTLAALLGAGSRVVAGRALFGSTLTLFEEVFAKWGVRTDYVDAHDLADWERALATPADVVFFETPSNPMLDLVDVRRVSDLAHAAGAVVVIDNVFATPVLQRPLTQGADVVVYSATKHIDGQGRVMGGAVLGSAEFIKGPLQLILRNTGPSLSPFNAWVLLKGLETMPLRVRAQTAAAYELAAWLETLPGVARVRYPFLASHPQAELARAQMSGGGTMVTFDIAAGVSGEGADGAVAQGPGDAAVGGAAAHGAVAGGVPADQATTFAFLDALQLILISNNLGDAKSLITHPATTTHRKIGPHGRAAVGITDATVRLSVGLEDVEDLRADIARALAAVSRAGSVAPRAMAEC